MLLAEAHCKSLIMLCLPLRAGYTFWLAAIEDGRLYTCDSQDDGYAGTLPQQRKPNNAGQLGRSGECGGLTYAGCCVTTPPAPVTGS